MQLFQAIGQHMGMWLALLGLAALSIGYFLIADRF